METNFFELIKIDYNSRKPKYQQIVDLIIHHISIRNLHIGQKIPSINMLREEFYLGKSTVVKAYDILKGRNIISSIRGKGYYIARTKLISKINVLFLVNKLSSYKMKIYNSLLSSLDPKYQIDLYIYHCDESLFLNLFNKYKFSYDYFVIMPHFKTKTMEYVSHTDAVCKAIDEIPKEKLIVMDNLIHGDDEKINSVYQDFENDIYNALKNNLDKIRNYKKVFLIYPNEAISLYPKRILYGFRKFCLESSMDFEVLNEIYEDMILKKGDLFITIEETDLVNLVKLVREDEYKLGSDIGIISYNDTPLKELLGITVISADFKFMGETAANMILNRRKYKVKTPFNFIDRQSL